MMAPTIAEPLAEAAFLGCLLATSAALVEAVRLEVEDFASPQHRAVFGCVLALVERGEVIDPITVLGELRRSGREKALTCDQSAGVFLHSLLAAAPNLGSASYYRRIVVEHRLRRAAHEAGERLQQIAEKGSSDELGALLVEAFDEVRRLAKRLPVVTL